MSDDRFVLTDALARSLAGEYGTPLYVLDEDSSRTRLSRYREAFANVWSSTSLSYASKANSMLRVLQIAHEEGFHIDVASEGELRAALLAGIPAKHCHFHGNGKTRTELEFALAEGVGQVIADSFEEIALLSELLPRFQETKVLLRLAPGVDPKTHQAISTGQADTKFGFNIGDGSAEKALEIALAHRLPVIGFHCHVGSQLLDPEAQRESGIQIARFAVEALTDHSFRTEILNLGGGLGVKYVDHEAPMQVDEYCRLLVEAVRAELGDSGLTPILAQEPGRSVIAEAGVTLYRVLAKKRVPTVQGSRTYLTVDGGLSDNPRPVMYGAGHEIRVIGKPNHDSVATIAGKHCETDNLLVNIKVPETTQAGDLIQVLCTGAYNASMASNYNRFLRPACVLLKRDGTREVIQARETWDQLFARETAVITFS